MKRKVLKRHFLIFLGLLLLNVPLFFDIYRTAAFNVVPHDDYVPYLLYLLDEGGTVPKSPTGYRLFSVLIAAPFYYVIPLFKFSYLEGKSDVYLKALEALTLVTCIASAWAALLMYKISRYSLGGSELISFVSALIALFLFRFTAIYGVDPTAILIISLLLYYIEQKFFFVLLLLLSIGFNEKIAFLFLMLFFSRLLFQRQRHFFYLSSSTFAFVSYFILRKFIDLPGHEYMVQPSFFWEKAQHTLGLLFTAKSIYLNLFPGALTLILFYLARQEQGFRKGKDQLLFSNVDFIPVIGFFIIAIITDMQYMIGRILLFCFPLYLPLATLYLERVLNYTKLDP